MQRIPDGLPPDRPQFDISKNFKVIKKESSIKNEDINETIDREGTHMYGAGSGEASWYYSHKGYSKDNPKDIGTSQLPG